MLERAVGKKREVGKFVFKLERVKQSSKEPIEVGKFVLKLESFAAV